MLFIETSVKSAWQPQGMSLSCTPCVYSTLALLEETMEKFPLCRLSSYSFVPQFRGGGQAREHKFVLLHGCNGGVGEEVCKLLRAESFH